MKRNLITIVVAGITLAACAEGVGPSNRPLENWEGGALIGAGVGAVVGAMAYHRDRTQGAVLGAVGGGLAGAAVGAYMDSQKRDLEKNLGKEIQAGQTRVETLPNHVVRITMTSQTAFETNSSDIKPGFDSTMDKLADVVVRYAKTTLTIVGHTDNVGVFDYNMSLSQRRAKSVVDQLIKSYGIAPERLKPAGAGMIAPVASNDDEAGRSKNRRVEIVKQ